jgi:hypothetical protein
MAQLKRCFYVTTCLMSSMPGNSSTAWVPHACVGSDTRPLIPDRDTLSCSMCSWAVPQEECTSRDFLLVLLNHGQLWKQAHCMYLYMAGNGGQCSRHAEASRPPELWKNGGGAQSRHPGTDVGRSNPGKWLISGFKRSAQKQMAPASPSNIDMGRSGICKSSDVTCTSSQ